MSHEVIGADEFSKALELRLAALSIAFTEQRPENFIVSILAGCERLIEENPDQAGQFIS